MNTKDFETGNDDSAAGVYPILPDRLTYIHQKGPDHPTPFAKGTYINDNTSGALDLKDKVPETNNEISESDYFQPPTGWKFSRLLEEDDGEAEESESISNENQQENDSTLQPNPSGLREFSNDDELEFIPREEFGGVKEGFVFRLGSKGLGYYSDK